MFNLSRILPVVLFFGAAACGEKEPEVTHFQPIWGGDAAIALDAALGTDAAIGADASLGFDAAAPGVDAAPPINTGDASLPVSEAGSADGGVDGAPAADASLDATAPGDATTSGDATSHDASPPAAPGPSQMRSVTVGGVTRTFLLYIPKSAVKTTPAPLVSVHHGFTMTGKIMEEISSWKKIAEREGIVVAFPDGGDPLGPWNVGENVCGIGSVVAGASSQDDFGFVKAIIDDANSQQAIDREAVFVGGFSMGGYFANNAGCKLRDVVRAVAAHSAGTYDGTCPGDPMPVLIIHGDADGLIEFMCGQQARSYWLSRNGCGAEVTTEQVKNGTCEWNQGCPAGREVGMCTMKDMDHGWAGAPTTGPGAWLTAPISGNLGYGGGDQYEDAAELMWKFFARYR